MSDIVLSPESYYFCFQRLEDELLTAKSMLKKVSDEACIRQSLYEKREVRLLEADTQLGVIQQEWVGAQETMQKEIMKLAAQCSELKEVGLCRKSVFLM